MYGAYFLSMARGGQAKICGRYADLVGTKMANFFFGLTNFFDHYIRNDDVIVGVAVKPNLKNCFFLKAIQNLGKLKEFQLLSICSLGFVCRYVVLWVTLTPPQ